MIHPNSVVIIRDEYVGNASRVEDQHINFRVITDAIFGDQACFFLACVSLKKGSLSGEVDFHFVTGSEVAHPMKTQLRQWERNVMS